MFVTHGNYMNKCQVKIYWNTFMPDHCLGSAAACTLPWQSSVDAERANGPKSRKYLLADP